MYISYLEIYNENVNDLLDVSKKNLEIRENKDGHIQVDKISKHRVQNAHEALQFL